MGINTGIFRAVILTVVGIILLLLTACTKPYEISGINNYSIDGENVRCERTLSYHSPWMFGVGQGIELKHTDGLITMALSGDIVQLNKEFCGIGDSSHRIPFGLGDDVYDVGYAAQLVLGDHVIAMYHPISEAPDHFITYNYKTGDWIHWNLNGGGNQPNKFKFGGTPPQKNGN